MYASSWIRKSEVFLEVILPGLKFDSPESKQMYVCTNMRSDVYKTKKVMQSFKPAAVGSGFHQMNLLLEKTPRTLLGFPVIREK